ncbi:MAG: S-methyl-5-thioribose-1-phosphate isomerase [Candidatus Bathyarchaeota archaeon]|nr:MAG: S-methyl-5-thioribose-1-phosphate isomerase [Candidatus Bathyarchaeota archaeon]
MKVRIDGTTKEVRTIWREGQTIRLIDQRKLPHRFEITTLEDHVETAGAIMDMVMRGAGAIGVAGGYGMAQAALEAIDRDLPEFERYLLEAAERLRSTRPTAANLFHAIERCLDASSTGTVAERVEAVLSEADAIAEDDLEASRQMGVLGNELIDDEVRILTHCNAGALAFIDYGTALSPIRLAHRQGKKIHVFVDETRPRCQGARLTAWELEQEGIPYSLIVDNAAGFFMRRGEVDMVIVGADRIAANGDVANKIGTYEKAVLAHENEIPFYVAAPRMTFDLTCKDGESIEIEERSPQEIVGMWGVDDTRNPSRILIASEGTAVRNPAFDVTPAKYVTAFITERGILSPPFSESIKLTFGEADIS